MKSLDHKQIISSNVKKGIVILAVIAGSILYYIFMLPDLRFNWNCILASDAVRARCGDSVVVCMQFGCDLDYKQVSPFLPIEPGLKDWQARTGTIALQLSVPPTPALPDYQDLNEIEMNYRTIIGGDNTSVKRAKQWKYNSTHAELELSNAKDKCHSLKKLFGFHVDLTDISAEELEYPLAYGAVVYKNFVQVMFMLSAFYRPHNEYCFAVSGSAEKSFKISMDEVANCFDNIHVFLALSQDFENNVLFEYYYDMSYEGLGRKNKLEKNSTEEQKIRTYYLETMHRPHIEWGSFEIINSTWVCVEVLARSKTNWMYYQQLSGVDVPLKTNLEMVTILKQLNDTVNSEFSTFQTDRLEGKKVEDSPLPLFKSSLSALVPRKAITRILEARKGWQLLHFLNGTHIPDETFWTTLTGNEETFPVPGGRSAKKWMKIVEGYRANHTEEVDKYTETKLRDASMHYYLARHQVWDSNCGGQLVRGSCVFGVDDLANMLKQPHLIAHKMYLDFQPAAFFCVLKEIREREKKPKPLNLTIYGELPQVELSSGVPYEKLKHPLWM